MRQFSLYSATRHKNEISDYLAGIYDMVIFDDYYRKYIITLDKDPDAWPAVR